MCDKSVCKARNLFAKTRFPLRIGAEKIILYLNDIYNSLNLDVSLFLFDLSHLISRTKSTIVRTDIATEQMIKPIPYIFLSIL